MMPLANQEGANSLSHALMLQEVSKASTATCMQIPGPRLLERDLCPFIQQPQWLVGCCAINTGHTLDKLAIYMATETHCTANACSVHHHSRNNTLAFPFEQ